MVFAALANRDTSAPRDDLRESGAAADLRRYRDSNLTTKPKYVNIADLNG